jgi:hypothetical protein
MAGGSAGLETSSSPAGWQRKALRRRARRSGVRIPAVILASCLFWATCTRAGAGATSVFVFQPDRSTIVQTGGIAGVHWTYRLEGQFRLTVDSEARTASFDQVDANATDDSPYQRTLDPNGVFNLTGLTGRLVDQTTIRFEGKADDGSSVLVTLTLADGTVALKGETLPPPHSADFFLFALDAVAQRKYAGGSGTKDDPYQIATAEQLAAIDLEADTRHQHFLLLNDVDLDPNLPGRRVYDHAVIAVFSGSFDGGIHRIRNLVIDCNRNERLGLFGYVSWDGQIRHLSLENVHVLSNAGGEGYGTGTLAGTNDGLVEDCHATGCVTGCESTGGLIGDALGTIRACSAQVAVAGGKGCSCVGGLVGWNGGLIVNSRAAGEVNAPAGSFRLGGLVGAMGYPADVDMGGERTLSGCTAGGRVSAGNDSSQLGGLVGHSAEGTITNCYATGAIAGGARCSCLGGLVGQNGAREAYAGDHASVISNCYATGCVSAGQDSGEIGGLVGCNEVGEVNGSYWDVETSGWTTSDGGTGKSTKEMQTAKTFWDAGWDFAGETENGTEDTWWIFEGRDYPRLSWEHVLDDGFEDGKAEPLWMLYQPEPQRVWLKEVNGRLEVGAVAQSADVDAMYVPNGWRLDATRDFALRVDFHFSPRAPANGRVTLGVIRSLDPAGRQWAELEAGCFDTGPFYLYEVSDGPWVQERQAARFADDGTLFLSYNADADELYFSYTGYGKASAWQIVPGLLHGRWASEAVYVILSGGSEGLALAAGDAWLDNFTVNAGVVQLVEPVTLPNTGDGEQDLDSL